MTYFCPALDPPLDGSGRKTTTLVRDLEYFIHTKFHQNPSSGSGEEVENVNSLTDARRQTPDDRRRTDAGQRVITIGHWSLWLLCPKKASRAYPFCFISKRHVVLQVAECLTNKDQVKCQKNTKKIETSLFLAL